MKIILIIFCATVALFAGGCALIMLSSSSFSGMAQSFPFAAIFGGIALLNVLVLLGLFGSRNPQRWAFYLLGGIDLLVVLALVAMWIGSGLGDRSMNLLAIFWIGVVLLKGLLTFHYGRRS